MKPRRYVLFALLHPVFVITAIILVSGPDVAAQGMPALVAKPYPGAVPEHMKDGKQTLCSDNENTYCFLTRDPVEKVKAFYAQEGIRLEPIPAGALANIGGGRSNFELALRYQLAEKPIGTLLVAPVEFYQTKGADDTPSYFNAVAVMTGAQRVQVPGDDKGRQAVIDDEVLGPLALSPQTKPLVAVYGNVFLDPAQLVPHYNQHLAMLSGFFRYVDGNSVAQQKREDMRQHLSNRDLRNEDVAAYLQALEKQVYYTRILIHASEGRRVKRDAATVQSEWKAIARSFGE
jgi:hypothetical protein